MMKKLEFRRHQKELKELDAMIRSAKRGVERAEKMNGTGSEQHTLAVAAFFKIATNVSKRSAQIHEIFKKAEKARGKQ